MPITQPPGEGWVGWFRGSLPPSARASHQLPELRGRVRENVDGIHFEAPDDVVGPTAQTTRFLRPQEFRRISGSEGLSLWEPGTTGTSCAAAVVRHSVGKARAACWAAGSSFGTSSRPEVVADDRGRVARQERRHVGLRAAGKHAQVVSGGNPGKVDRQNCTCGEGCGQRGDAGSGEGAMRIFSPGSRSAARLMELRTLKRMPAAWARS